MKVLFLLKTPKRSERPLIRQMRPQMISKVEMAYRPDTRVRPPPKVSMKPRILHCYIKGFHFVFAR